MTETREYYENAYRYLLDTKNQLEKEKEKKEKDCKYYEKRIQKMINETEEILKDKNLEIEPKYGISFSQRIRLPISKENYIHLLITIDLTCHSNKDEYANKISEICEFIESHKVTTIQPIINHNRDGDKYLIRCPFPYQDTFQNYQQKYLCRWFELKSMIYDLFELRKSLLDTYK